MILLRPLARYADFKGRASRSEYTLFLLSQGVVYFVCATMAVISLTNGVANGLAGLLGWLTAALILMAALALPNFAILARRLHDVGASALWMALMLPGMASQFANLRTIGSLAEQMPTAKLQAEAGVEPLMQTLAAQGSGLGMLMLVALVSNAALLVMTLAPGKPGTNRFGPDPKETMAGASDGGGHDMDRWDALIAEAKQGAAPHRPVFEPGPTTIEMASPRAAAPTPPQIFGRRKA